MLKDGWVGLWVSHVQEEADTWCALMVYAGHSQEASVS